MNKTLHQVGESPRPIFRKQALQGGAARLLFTLPACISILAVVLICVFLFANGIPGMAKIGVWDFLSGQKWKPGCTFTRLNYFLDFRKSDGYCCSLIWYGIQIDLGIVLHCSVLDN